MSPTRLILIRHGLTDWNASNRFQGQADVPLNATGEQQARAMAPVIAGYEPTVLYASPLTRARVTAETLAAETGLEITFDERLKEINVGDWSGLTIEEAIALDPAFGHALANDLDHRRSATGENGVETGERMGVVLCEIAERHRGENVAIVSHGLAIRMGIASLLGWPYPVAVALAGMGNCAWSVLLARRDAWRLEAYNRRA